MQYSMDDTSFTNKNINFSQIILHIKKRCAWKKSGSIFALRCISGIIHDADTNKTCGLSLAECCNFIAVFAYCHDMLSVVCDVVALWQNNCK